MVLEEDDLFDAWIGCDHLPTAEVHLKDCVDLFVGQEGQGRIVERVLNQDFVVAYPSDRTFNAIKASANRAIETEGGVLVAYNPCRPESLCRCACYFEIQLLVTGAERTEWLIFWKFMGVEMIESLSIGVGSPGAFTSDDHPLAGCEILP
jgi:hypothetical protein